ncbi:hypothetical protein ACFW04_014593 [Cataglyphis niger]
MVGFLFSVPRYSPLHLLNKVFSFLICRKLIFSENENFRRFIIKKLISLEMKLNIIQRYQKSILQKQSIKKEKSKFFKIYHSKIKLETVETKLNNDSTYRKYMIKRPTDNSVIIFSIKQLAQVVSYDTSCIRLMRQIFTNQLAMRYSWYGAKKKNIFSNLQLCKVIMYKYYKFKIAMRIRNSHGDAMVDQIASPIKI